MIRKANERDLNKLLKLYTQLHNNPLPQINSTITAIWDKIISDDNHYIIVAENENNIISSCVLVIIPNLTHNQQPYAIIENVITDERYRNMGYASKILDYAKRIAIENNCYKIMLMTSSKQDSTLNFYRKAGYNSEDKTAFIQWLNVYYMKLNRTPFDKIKSGEKTIEIRCNDEKRQMLKENDIIVFQRVDNKKETITTRVKALYRFKTFYELYSAFGFSEFGCKEYNMQRMLDETERIYSKDKEQKYGALGIRIEVI